MKSKTPPSISGLQLCRLLRSEPATANVAVILCGDIDDPQNRYWADRAGADAYVPKHRTGDLVRALGRTIKPAKEDDGFFFQLGGGKVDIRDRIARHIDAALFESIIAAEVRSLAASGTFERMFDLLAQFMSQMSRYRWLAVSTEKSGQLALHHHSRTAALAEEEARTALGLSVGSAVSRVEDEDALDGDRAAPPVVRDILFGDSHVGRIALSPLTPSDVGAAEKLVALVARELGGPLRMTSLMDESQRLASTDALTGLTNRRAFTNIVKLELARSRRHGYPLSLLLLDIDHFKQINDGHGHGVGDRVLAAIGGLLGKVSRQTDVAARWGGEEFVVALLSTAAGGAAVVAERIREAIESMVVVNDVSARVPVTASIGLVQLEGSESMESFVARADRAMYASKAAGRNRLTIGGGAAAEPPALEAGEGVNGTHSPDRAYPAA
jgi:two-component system cell cycle response regulator